MAVVFVRTKRGAYHRKFSSTQTDADAQRQIESQEIWGRAARGSDIPKVKAWVGPLPDGAAGVEFDTDVPPDAHGLAHLPTWSGPRDGVRVEDGWAKIAVRVTLVRKTQPK